MDGVQSFHRARRLPSKHKIVIYFAVSVHGVTFSLKHFLQPANVGKCVRIFLTVIMYCQTYVTPSKNGLKPSRDDLTCKITYCSVGKHSDIFSSLVNNFAVRRANHFNLFLQLIQAVGHQLRFYVPSTNVNIQSS